MFFPPSWLCDGGLLFALSLSKAREGADLRKIVQTPTEPGLKVKKGLHGNGDATKNREDRILPSSMSEEYRAGMEPANAAKTPRQESTPYSTAQDRKTREKSISGPGRISKSS